jgi:hypothetical protein
MTMLETVSPYAAITAVLLLVLILGFLWICWHAMRSGSEFEGEIKNRLVSMRIKTNPSQPPAGSDPPAAPPPQDGEA